MPTALCSTFAVDLPRLFPAYANIKHTKNKTKLKINVTEEMNNVPLVHCIARTKENRRDCGSVLKYKEKDESWGV